LSQCCIRTTAQDCWSLHCTRRLFVHSLLLRYLPITATGDLATGDYTPAFHSTFFFALAAFDETDEHNPEFDETHEHNRSFFPSSVQGFHDSPWFSVMVLHKARISPT
jgi:hypothetical protein